MNTLGGMINSRQTSKRNIYQGACAESYDKTFKNFDHDLKFISDLVATSSSGPSDILVLGAGTGDWAICLAEQGHNVTAIDVSCDMLAMLQGKAQSKSVSVSTIQADMAQFESTIKYSYVFIPNNAIMHLSQAQLKKTFKLCYRNLKEGGMLYCDHVVNAATNSVPNVAYATSKPKESVAYEVSLVDVEHITRNNTQISNVYLRLNSDGTYSSWHSKTIQNIHSASKFNGALKKAGFRDYVLNPHYQVRDRFLFIDFPTTSIYAYK